MGLTLIIPEWFLVCVCIFITVNIILEMRKGSLIKKQLKLQKEIFTHEKDIHQYAAAIAAAKRLAKTPNRTSKR